jgi:hypothetical protein
MDVHSQKYARFIEAPFIEEPAEPAAKGGE